MIEIQIVPSDIRRRVRYFFLDRRRVTIGIAALTFILVAIMGSMAAAPTVIRRVYKENYLSVMRHEREIQRERLREHVVQMSSLERTLDEERLRVEKLVTAYGLDRTLGQGGFSIPVRAKIDPNSHDVDEAISRERALKSGMRRLQEQLDLLVRYESANAEIVRHTPSILPVPADQFVLTSPFGSRLSPFTRDRDFHKGLDLSAPAGTPIYASADGIVSFAGRVPLSQSISWWRMGNVVVINHAGRFMTIYGHCDKVTARSGQQIKQGEVVATVGSTGWSTNSHLHYEVRSDIEQEGAFVAVDPRIYILNYQWNNEALLLMKARSSREYKNYDPLPPAFVGRRRES